MRCIPQRLAKNLVDPCSHALPGKGRRELDDADIVFGERAFVEVVKVAVKHRGVYSTVGRFLSEAVVVEMMNKLKDAGFTGLCLIGNTDRIETLGLEKRINLPEQKTFSVRTVEESRGPLAHVDLPESDDDNWTMHTLFCWASLTWRMPRLSGNTVERSTNLGGRTS